MIRFVYRSALLLAIVTGLCYAEESRELRTRVGIMDPLVNGGGKDDVAATVEALSKSFTEMGGYDIILQKDMETSFKDMKERFPRYCREPGCVSAVGEALSCNRMVFGTVDKGDKSWGVRLTLVDVETHEIVENASMEGNAGVSLPEVMNIAVRKLHGQAGDSLAAGTHAYYGREVHNEKELLVTAAVCVGAGALVSIINGSAAAGEKNPDMVFDYSSQGSDELSGVNASATGIPMFARPGAMGGCYIAASDDAFGVFYNPAGLAWAAGAEGAIGYQYGLGTSTVAASYINKATRELGFGQGLFYNGSHGGLFYEMYFVSSIAYKLNSTLKFMRPISFGADLKIMNSRTGSVKASSESISATGIGANLDAGLKTELSDKIAYGLLFKNIPLYERWNNATTGKSYMENNPVELIMGGTFQANYATFLICEGDIPLYKTQNWKFGGGVERMLFSVLAIRAGAKKEVVDESPWKLTGGLGLTVNKVVFDASYQFNTQKSLAHIINCTFRYRF